MIQGYTYEYYKKAADYITSRISIKPETAIILGTGCGPFAKKIKNCVEIPYIEIPGFPVTTNTNHAGKMIIGTVNSIPVLCMNGRFHYYEGYSMEELSIPVHVLHILGIKTLILTNAAGSCNPIIKPGDVMIIKDHIKLFEGSPMRGPNVEKLGPRFFSVSDLYNENLRQIAKGCAQNNKIKVHEGVYMFFPGPQFETKAEIRAARILGADAVGMSTVTEALTAAHCGMKLLGLSLITNMANGMTDEDLDGSEVEVVAQSAAEDFSLFIENIIKSL